MPNLGGKVAVVTGGGQGIGLGISRALQKAGAAVLIAQRSAPSADLGEAGWVRADLGERESFGAIEDAVRQQFGRLDILVNNAGFMFEKNLEALSFDDWNRMLAVNLSAPLFLSRQLLPLLREAGNASIINIGSIEGLAANPEHAAYCATKGGVHALTRALAVDLGRDGIRVNAIAPGWIRSDLSDDYINAQADPAAVWEELKRLHPVGRVGEPDDVGKLTVFLASPDAGFVTGQVVVIDGGRTSKLPLPF